MSTGDFKCYRNAVPNAFWCTEYSGYVSLVRSELILHLDPSDETFHRRLTDLTGQPDMLRTFFLAFHC